MLSAKNAIEAVMADPQVRAHLQTLDLDVHEGTALFHLLDNGDGEVSTATHGCWWTCQWRCMVHSNDISFFIGPKIATDIHRLVPKPVLQHGRFVVMMIGQGFLQFSCANIDRVVLNVYIFSTPKKCTIFGDIAT